MSYTQLKDETDDQFMKRMEQLNRVLWLMRMTPSDWKNLRIESGLELRELAKFVGIAHTTLFRWEDGSRTPRTDRKEVYANTLFLLWRAKKNAPRTDLDPTPRGIVVDKEMKNRILRLGQKQGEALDAATELINKAGLIIDELEQLMGVTEWEVEEWYNQQNRLPQPRNAG